MVSPARWLACVGLALLAGCGSGAPAAGSAPDAAVSRERFIELYAALRLAARETRDTLAFEVKKREILERHGVGEGALLEFARAHGGDIPAMVELWDSLDARLTLPDTLDPPT